MTSLYTSQKRAQEHRSAEAQGKAIPLQNHLLAWYRKNARNLPWRRTKDPYRIWVSEIMLQQTQVQTVIPYYEKWVQRFPTVESLAKADISTVLSHWAGLGYYRRARMLHAGAQFVAQLPGKILPSSPEELVKIPGIGRYTAGAIASIAFDKPAPLVDGNVIRVLTRIFAIKMDIALPQTIEKIWQIAAEIVPQKKAGDFNQALMELGATVCFPQNPACGKCPVSKDCAAKAEGKTEKYPVKRQKEVYESLQTFALICRGKNSVLLQRQALRERWGGLWMFPHWMDKENMLKEAGCGISDLKHRMTVKHGFTKYRISLEVYEFNSPSAVSYQLSAKTKITESRKLKAQSKERQAKWVSIKDLSKFALPAPHRKIAKELLADE